MTPDQGLEPRPLITLPSDDGPQFGVGSLQTHQCLHQKVEPLHRHQTTDGDHQRHGRPLTARGEPRLHPWRGHRDPIGGQMETFDDLGFGRVRQRHDAAPAVERRGDPVLEGMTQLGQSPRKHHLPHLGVYMMQEGDLRAA